ncbi:MAG: mismatch repair protein MutT [Microbacteriaceae bacterium]|nr:mismatch repair protein MutT [Microbacteriaceae bacterium]
MVERSSGILLYRFARELEIFAGHMGGPFWARKDAAAWSIPKGLPQPGETPLRAALREFEEEIGIPAPSVPYDVLGEFRQASGKIVTIFAAEADIALDRITGGTFELEWPPRSGRTQLFPEIDVARWLSVADARVKLVKGQVAAVDAVIAAVSNRNGA